ncbi:MAG TPA: aconitate hydratase AcnA [Anaerolineaceae bacterium]
MPQDIFNCRTTLNTPDGSFTYYSLPTLERAGAGRLDRLPYSLRIILESVLRHADEVHITRQDVLNLLNWQAQANDRPAMAFYPGRVILQDLTGVPVMNDLAAMRSAFARQGGDPAHLQPILPVDLVIDHSVQVDFTRVPDALQKNTLAEFERNQERFEFLRWAQGAFKNFRIVPPATGIIHQVNLEYLSQLVLTREENEQTCLFPDSVVGTDSHTTMINGLGVPGWGVGGIEAVATMLGQPIEMVIPAVIGFRLTGALREGVSPTDLALTIVQILRKKGVVDQIVEFTGPGLDSLTLADRAMIANMSPENGATMTYFPVDQQTLDYLSLTNRPVNLVETYYRAQRLFRTPSSPEPEFTSIVELDLSQVEPSLAGPRRPQDRLSLADIKPGFINALPRPKSEGGFAVSPERLEQKAVVDLNGAQTTIGHGAVVVAAITSCTNTSNPSVMLAAGLLARKALEKGLHVPAHVKTSLAPGSRVVTALLEAAGVLDALEQIGFQTVAYGCTTCIGNTGPLVSEVTRAIEENQIVAAAVLSGNRNFEGRISPHAQANYLASPPLVVAYALAGRVDIDLTCEPLGCDAQQQPIYLRDLYPSSAEVQHLIQTCLTKTLFEANYSRIFDGNDRWNQLSANNQLLYEWNPKSTYLREPPFFKTELISKVAITGLRDARVLAYLGDSVTTDHISPAGDISSRSAAGIYLLEQGVDVPDFNSYGARRGNDEVMRRGTFANIRLKNRLIPGVEGGFTLHIPSRTQMSIFEASQRYQQENTPLIILAGKEYGTGSSRDWAAKGPLLLGIRAVIAESFERIHRSNLAGMGVLPLQFLPGESATSLGLTGTELYTIPPLPSDMIPGGKLFVIARTEDGKQIGFSVRVRLDTVGEITSFRRGGILHHVLYERLHE